MDSKHLDSKMGRRDFLGTVAGAAAAVGQASLMGSAQAASEMGGDITSKSASELAAAIRTVVGGGRAIDPALAAATITEGESPLTAREHEVLAASRNYATVADIAAALYLSPGTVRNHLSSVMQKLDARNRAEALKLADEKGWL